MKVLKAPFVLFFILPVLMVAFLFLGGSPREAKKLLAQTADQNYFSFIVYGDSRAGSDCAGNANHIKLVNQAANEPIDFAIHLGDMITGFNDNTGWVQNGSCAGSNDYGSFKNQIAPLQNKIPKTGLPAFYFPTIGNHDDGNTGIYPDLYGNTVCDVFNQNFLKSIIPNHTQGAYFRDKTGRNLKIYTDEEFYSLMCSATTDEVYSNYFYYSFNYKNSHFIVLRLDLDNYNFKDCNACADENNYEDYPNIHQYHWLQDDLAKTKADPAIKNTFVFLHTPLFTTANGHKANVSWKLLAKEFSKYGVKMVFSGHNHVYERTVPIYSSDALFDPARDDFSGIVYITAGGGGSPLSGFRDPQWFDAARESKFHYVKIGVNDQNVSVQAVDINNNVFDRFASPIIAPIGDRAASEGQPMNFSVSASDPDGDAVNFSASDLPVGAKFDAATQIFSWTPDYNQSGIYNVTFSASDGELSDFETIAIAVSEKDPPPRGFAVGPLKSGGPHLRFFDFNGSLVEEFFAYERTLRGGLSFAIKDLDRDGATEIITGPGKGREPEVRIFKSDGARINQFMAYSNNFKGGVNIAAGDLDGNGQREIITSPRRGAPHIRIFGLKNGEWLPLNPGFFAYSKKMTYGVNIVAADLDGDGKDEIIATPNQAASPSIKVFGLRDDKIKQIMPQIYAFDPSFKGGVNLSAGDINGDGKDEILASPSISGGSSVKIFRLNSENKLTLSNAGFLALDSAIGKGADTTIADIGGDGKGEIIAASAGYGEPIIRIFSSDKFKKLKEFRAYPSKKMTGLMTERW